MTKRDWQKDWELAESLIDSETWDLVNKVARHVCRVRDVSNVLFYWLNRVREMESLCGEALEVIKELRNDLKKSYFPLKEWPPHIEDAQQLLCELEEVLATKKRDRLDSREAKASQND